jgi:aldose 1-epimerase
MDKAEVIIEHGDWQARLRPDLGGVLAGLDYAGVPVLRAMPEGAASPLDAACFPMVPWCNRIAGARFGWGGAGVALTPNFPPEPHAIHGHGWQSAWAVESREVARCVMVHRHEAQASGGWPWAYEARQDVVLDDGGCTITLNLTNRSPAPMPAGLGLHPYLRRRPESRVCFGASSLVAVGPDLIPTGERLPPQHFADFGAGAALPPALIDHCYAGWDGEAVVTDALGHITLAARGAAHLHLYAPPEAPDILCLEPVNHLPDAINAGAMPLCGPGESVSLSLLIGAG